MKTQPGLIILLGSGETSASIRTVYHWLFKRLSDSIHVAILETPAGFEPNSPQVAGQIANFLQQRLQNFHPRTVVIPARKRGTPHSPDDPTIVAPLLEANVIMMGPGSPTYATRQLQDSLAWQTLVARHRLGATLIFASAATVAVSAQTLPVYEIYKVGADLHWQPGLNLLADFGLSLVFIPHWNNNDGGIELDTSRCYMGQARYNQLVGLLPANATIVGIDERTALVIDPVTVQGQVMGQGTVTITRGGQEAVFATGQTFALGKLGPFCHLPDPKVNIPAEIWNRVQAAQTATTRPAEKEAEPPTEALALLEKRNIARRQKDWTNADRFRDELAALGWQVNDTSEGSQLQPL